MKSSHHEFLCTFISYEDLENALNKKYPHTYKLDAGSLSWTRKTKEYSLKSRDLYDDILISSDLKIYCNYLDLVVMKTHTKHYSARCFGISVCGMRAINSYIWRNYPLDTSYRHMISEQQVNLMCWISAYLCNRYQVPIENVKTQAEYGQMELYKWQGHKLYPYRWDFDNMGDQLRDNIQYYLSKRQ